MKTVLHILPHPGGGGETYVDALAGMVGYRFERRFIAPSATPTPTAAVAALRAQLDSRRHDLLHVHGEVAATLCLPALALRPSVVTLHGLHLLRRLSGRAREAAVLNLQLLVRAASVTICVADSERNDLLEAVGVTAERRAVVIHNGVGWRPLPSADERAAARAALQLPADAVTGLFVGSLDERKDPLTAARAAVAVAEEGARLILIVAGDGPLRRELEQLAAGNEALRPLGFRIDVGELLAAADFLVLPSRREGLPYAVLEAMALAVPCVVSDDPGNLEAVGDCGIVVRRGDVGGFANAFRQLLVAFDRVELGSRARERVRQEFDLDRMVRETEKLYDGLIAT